MAKRVTTNEEKKRILERIRSHYKGMVINRDSFNVYFSEITGLSESEMSDKQKTLRNSCFREYKKQYPSEVQKGVKDFERVEKKQKTKRELNIPARSRGKIVYTEKVHVIVNHRRQVRFRDKNGRFCSVRPRK